MNILLIFDKGTYKSLKNYEGTEEQTDGQGYGVTPWAVIAAKKEAKIKPFLTPWQSSLIIFDEYVGINEWKGKDWISLILCLYL